MSGKLKLLSLKKMERRIPTALVNNEKNEHTFLKHFSLEALDVPNTIIFLNQRTEEATQTQNN